MRDIIIGTAGHIDHGENSLIYAFYGIDDGEFIKAYRINNSR